MKATLDAGMRPSTLKYQFSKNLRTEILYNVIANDKQERPQKVSVCYLNNIIFVDGLKVPVHRSAAKVAFGQFRIFPTSHQLSPTQKYIYTWPIQKILDVLKSYESESSISAV